MAETGVVEQTDTEATSAASRVYEVGYHVSPAVKEEDIEKIVGEIRSVIESAGGEASGREASGEKAITNFIAEGAPALTKLAYGISIKENGK